MPYSLIIKFCLHLYKKISFNFSLSTYIKMKYDLTKGSQYRPVSLLSK